MMHLTPVGQKLTVQLMHFGVGVNLPSLGDVPKSQKCWFSNQMERFLICWVYFTSIHETAKRREGEPFESELDAKAQ